MGFLTVCIYSKTQWTQWHYPHSWTSAHMEVAGPEQVNVWWPTEKLDKLSVGIKLQQNIFTFERRTSLFWFHPKCFVQLTIKYVISLPDNELPLECLINHHTKFLKSKYTHTTFQSEYQHVSVLKCKKINVLTSSKCLLSYSLGGLGVGIWNN